MTDEDVERVAKAIYEADDPWHKAWAWPDLNPEAQGGQSAVDKYRDIARAAIAAMPTDAVAERQTTLAIRNIAEAAINRLTELGDNTDLRISISAYRHLAALRPT